jgi:hypothetical protein
MTCPSNDRRPQNLSPENHVAGATARRVPDSVCSSHSDRSAATTQTGDALRITEVLRGVGQQADFQALCARDGELQPSIRSTERCSAMLTKAT